MKKFISTNALSRTAIAASALAASLAVAAPAHAQDEPSSGVSVSGSVTLVSDYRFRGVTQSGEDPAIQGGLTLNGTSGLYGGIWASSLEEDMGYGSTEVDFFAGYRTEISPGTTLDGGVLYYVYPNAEGLDFFEPYASITTTLGPATAKLGAAYAWSQDAIGDANNVYVYGDVLGGIPNTPVTLRGHLGYSDGSLSWGAGNYLDWNLGIDYATGPLLFGISYIDTDLPSTVDGADSTIVFSVGAAF